MSLRLKANLLYGVTAAVVVTAAMLGLGHAAHRQRLAAAEVQARLMMAQADATARYMQDEVGPQLAAVNPGGLLFVPQTTPFYAVERQSKLLSQAEPGYSLRRVVLDSTGPTDRPSSWDRAVIDRLRATANPVPFIEERHGSDGDTLVLAMPLRMADGICATCYPSKAAAPPGAVDAFGAHGGFNRKPGEIVGITVASVPLSESGDIKGDAAFWLIAAALALLAVLNAILELAVLRPLGHVAAIAEQVSLGKPGIKEFDTRGDSEIGSLTRSFNRLRRSMESALGLLEL